MRGVSVCVPLCFIHVQTPLSCSRSKRLSACNNLILRRRRTSLAFMVGMLPRRTLRWLLKARAATAPIPTAPAAPASPRATFAPVGMLLTAAAPRFTKPRTRPLPIAHLSLLIAASLCPKIFALILALMSRLTLEDSPERRRLRLGPNIPLAPPFRPLTAATPRLNSAPPARNASPAKTILHHPPCFATHVERWQHPLFAIGTHDEKLARPLFCHIQKNKRRKSI